jgi:hypothetical protein
MRRPLAWSSAALAAATLGASSGCVDTDPAVFVEASIVSPAATVSAGALGTNLTASFQLKLHLGSRASGPSQVSIRSFEIASAARAPLVSPLEVTTSATLPVEVAPDSDVTVDFAFDTRTEGTPLPTDTAMPLCATDGLRIVGAIEDSLEDGATPVASDVFRADCP